MVNPDLYVDWDAVSRQQEIESIQRRINNVANTQALQLTVNTILVNLFDGEELAKAKLYEGAITRFLLDNIKEENLNNFNLLSSIVRKYYRVLTGINVHISDYLFLEQYTKPYSTEIKSYLENKYQECRATLLFCADLFELDANKEDTDKLLNQIIFKYEDRNAIGRLYHKVTEKYKVFGKDADRVVAAELKKIKDAYETVVTLRTNDIYRIQTDKERQTLVVRK